MLFEQRDMLLQRLLHLSRIVSLHRLLQVSDSRIEIAGSGRSYGERINRIGLFPLGDGARFLRIIDRALGISK